MTPLETIIILSGVFVGVVIGNTLVALGYWRTAGCLSDMARVWAVNICAS